MLAALAIFVAVPAAFWSAGEPPADPVGLAKWLTKHPTDYAAASALTDQALDLDLPRRVALWRAAYALAHEVAPYRLNAPSAFTRTGLAHWYELSGADRAAVLRTIEPLLHDNQFFGRNWKPVWEVTGDVDLLRRANPGTQEALINVAQLAVVNGRFDIYRVLRDDLARRRLADLQANRAGQTPAELLNSLPDPPYRVSDEPLIRAVLDELHRRPLDEPSNATKVTGVIDYALPHHLQPLDGLEWATHDASIPAPVRARLALRLGRADLARNIEIASVTSDPSWHDYFLDRAAFERDPAVSELYRARAAATAPPAGWQGLCQRDVCSRATAGVRGPVRLTIEPVQSDEVPAYVEVYVDDRRAAEGEIRGRQTFAIPGDGEHRVEVDLVNPMTRNRFQRRVRIV